MKTAGEFYCGFLGILALVGIVFLTGCETDVGDMTLLSVNNQTAEQLAMYVDGSDSPELTVPAHQVQALVFHPEETHQVKWQGTTIQGQGTVTIPTNAARTLAIWGSGNAYSLK